GRPCLPETTPSTRGVPSTRAFRAREKETTYAPLVLRNAIRPAAIVAFLAAFVPVRSVRADSWVNTGPEAGVVNCIGPSPSDASVVYVGIANGGVYRSADGGATWSPANTGLAELNVLSLAVAPSDPQHVVAGTSAGGYRSINGGPTRAAVHTAPRATGVD